MTRAERWVRNTRDAAARQPRVSFNGVQAYASSAGNLIIEIASMKHEIPARHVPALTKFMREYFVRRDK